MSKKKTKGIWGGYKQYTLTDGTKFIARDDSDAELYRQKVSSLRWSDWLLNLLETYCRNCH